MATSCLNCGTAVSASFCPNCGQPTGDRRRSVFSLFGEFFTEFLSLDGRHLRTFKQLFVPGRLTELYLEGKRASYVPPVRVYFVASLVFFLVVGIPTPDAEDFNVYVDDTLIGRDEPDPELGNLQLSGLDKRSRISNALEPHILPYIDRLQAMPAQDLLDRFFEGLERNISTTLIFFVPILAMALKLLYVRRPFFYVDHLVFALHFQSFMFVAFVFAHFANVVGVARFFHPSVTYLGAFLLVTPIYMLLALRRVYGQGWGRTLLKTGLLGMLYLVLIQPVLLLTFLLTIRSM